MAAAATVIEVEGRRIECAWHRPSGGHAADAPVLVLLHEGLGCVAMWRDFPARLAEATGLPAFVYSRFGYGGSDACALPRPLRYMHDEGLTVLPALLRAAGIGRHILVGHSDGASIALIYAGGTPAAGLDALVVEAPHVFVEDMNIASIAAVREDYRTSELRERLVRYHGANVDCAFYGWADAWLDPGFQRWNLEEYLPQIRVPMLIVQGLDDQYGTKAQCDAIARQSAGTTSVVMMPACGHSPHRDQPDQTLAAMQAFIADTAGRAPTA